MIYIKNTDIKKNQFIVLLYIYMLCRLIILKNAAINAMLFYH